jgi:outer membrane lipoprotein-sorting protein
MVVAGLALVLVLAGCVGLAGDDSSLPDPEEAAERYERLESFRASFTQNITTDGETRHLFGETVQRPGQNQYRTEVDGDLSRTTVSNGTTFWQYIPKENRVVRSPIRPENSVRNINRTIRRLVEAARSDEETEFDPLGSLLPGGGNTREDVTGPVNITYEGTTEFLDREAHIIDIEGDTLEERHFFDTEYFVPLGWRSNRTGDSDWRVSMQFEEIEFNPPDVEDSQFQFTPPENATVRTPLSDTDIETFDSREALVAATDLDVPNPDVPDGLSLRRASLERSTGSNRTPTELALEYTGAFASLSVSAVDDTIEPNESVDTEPVTVDGRDGSFRELGRQARVRWLCEEQTRFVVGTFSKNRLVAIAASVGC